MAGTTNPFKGYLQRVQALMSSGAKTIVFCILSSASTITSSLMHISSGLFTGFLYLFNMSSFTFLLDYFTPNSYLAFIGATKGHVKIYETIHIGASPWIELFLHAIWMQKKADSRQWMHSIDLRPLHLFLQFADHGKYGFCLIVFLHIWFLDDLLLWHSNRFSLLPDYQTVYLHVFFLLFVLSLITTAFRWYFSTHVIKMASRQA